MQTKSRGKGYEAATSSDQGREDEGQQSGQGQPSALQRVGAQVKVSACPESFCSLLLSKVHLQSSNHHSTATNTSGMRQRRSYESVDGFWQNAHSICLWCQAGIQLFFLQMTIRGAAGMSLA